jgi:signal transduction histidine kinase
LYRRTRGNLLGGVARGLADHLGIEPIYPRIAFVVLTFIGGAGILLYAAFWFFVPVSPNDPAPPRERSWNLSRIVALGALTIGAQLVIQWLGLGLSGALVWPLVLAAFGVAVLWQRSDAEQRARWWAVAEGRESRHAMARNAIGIALVLAGMVVFLGYHGQLAQVRAGVVAAAVMVAGVGLITGPWWLRTVRELTEERRERIRSQERAEVAAHLHDSVLHTLTLIQRHVEDPREVARLARSQERELRAWLYKPDAAADRDFAAALEEVAAEVEDAHRVSIDVVVVGDCPLDDRLGTVMQAAREAMVNAAKYAGGIAISVYAEVEPGAVEVFIRDRGPGFVMEDVPEDRLGIRQSIVGRVERKGGTAVIRTAPGEGTEVRLSMNRLQVRP